MAAPPGLRLTASAVAAVRREPAVGRTLGAADLSALALALLVTALAAGEILFGAGVNTGDYLSHALVAERLWRGGAVPPHFLYHLTVNLVHAAVPLVDFLSAARLVAFAAYLASTVIVFVVVRAAAVGLSAAARAGVAAGAAVTMLVIAPITLPTIPYHNLYLGYLVPNSYHNPTIVFLKPFAVPLALVSASAAWGRPAGRGALLVAFLLATGATLAKPNYSICLVPALLAVVGLRLVLRRPVHWGIVVVGILLPLGLTLVFQYLLSKALNLDVANAVEFHPGYVFGKSLISKHLGEIAYGRWLLARVFLSIALPIVVTVSWWRTARRDTFLLLGWLTFVVGAFYSEFLTEGHGPDTLAGNFAWSGQIASYMLTLAAVRHLAARLRPGGPAPAYVFAGVVLIIQLGCGVVWYWAQLDPTRTLSWR